MSGGRPHGCGLSSRVHLRLALKRVLWTAQTPSSLARVMYGSGRPAHDCWPQVVKASPLGEKSGRDRIHGLSMIIRLKQTAKVQRCNQRSHDHHPLWGRIEPIQQARTPRGGPPRSAPRYSVATYRAKSNRRFCKLHLGTETARAGHSSIFIAGNWLPGQRCRRRRGSLGAPSHAQRAPELFPHLGRYAGTLDYHQRSRRLAATP